MAPRAGAAAGTCLGEGSGNRSAAGAARGALGRARRSSCACSDGVGSDGSACSTDERPKTRPTATTAVLRAAPGAMAIDRSTGRLAVAAGVLAGKKSAKVTVTGSVPFGAPDSAKKTLH